MDVIYHIPPFLAHFVVQVKLCLFQHFQASSASDIFNNSANKETENGRKTLQDRTELWKPLNCLVEAANRTKSFKSTQQNSVIKAEQKDVRDSETNSNKTRGMEHPHKSKVQDEKNNNVQMPPASVKPRRLKGVNQKRRNLAHSSQTLPDDANAKSDKRITPLWFSLVASFDQLCRLIITSIIHYYPFMFNCPLTYTIINGFRTGDPSLPQISTNYLRIK